MYGKGGGVVREKWFIGSIGNTWEHMGVWGGFGIMWDKNGEWREWL